ncbi:MAG: peroxiredoxin [Nitrospirota bacterium]
MTTMNELRVGDQAPDFTLKDQDEKEVTLSSFRGKKHMVLAFYPLDWSPVCTKENVCFTRDQPRFEDNDTAVLGISIDSTWSHKAWKESLGLKHTLLSDMNREVCKSYGLYLEKPNISKRATVIVDKEGKIRFYKVQDIKTQRDNEEILKVLADLKKG